MTFPAPDMPLTHILVVADVALSRHWYTDVLGADLYLEYGGDSAVLSFNGAWLLLVTGSGPTDDKPTVTLTPPEDRDRLDHLFTVRVPDCRAAYETLRPRRRVPDTASRSRCRVTLLLPRSGWPPVRDKRVPTGVRLGSPASAPR